MMGWAAMSNKMPGCHLANAWRSRSKHILQWRYRNEVSVHSFIHQILVYFTSFLPSLLPPSFPSIIRSAGTHKHVGYKPLIQFVHLIIISFLSSFVYSFIRLFLHSFIPSFVLFHHASRTSVHCQPVHSLLDSILYPPRGVPCRPRCVQVYWILVYKTNQDRNNVSTVVSQSICI